MERMKDQELKAKWLGALRSGEYEQCVGMLKNETGYCCLGVLHKVKFAEEPPVMYQLPSSGILPDVDVDDYPLQNPSQLLADMNDSGKTFSEIADWIEENL